MAPSFRRGFPATFGFIIAAIMAVISIRLLLLREQKKDPEAPETSLEAGVVIEHDKTADSAGEADKATEKK
ncbi:hypothetical protein COL922a_013073 [Colletotrichum nupharicola]|nr:hypothetical protein COL922a_013073 [Colletotrichum nupharicola]